MPTLTQRPPEKGFIFGEVRLLANHEPDDLVFDVPPGWEVLYRLVEVDINIKNKYTGDPHNGPDAALMWIQYTGKTYGQTVQSLGDGHTRTGDLPDDHA